MIKNYTNGTEQTGTETIFQLDNIINCNFDHKVQIPARQKIFLSARTLFNNLKVIAGDNDTYHLELGLYMLNGITFSMKVENLDKSNADESDKFLFKGSNIHTALMTTKCPFYIIENLSNNAIICILENEQVM